MQFFTEFFHLFLQGADLFPRLLADGADAEADGADFQGLARLGIEAVGHDLLRQAGNDQLLAPRRAFDGYGAGDEGLAAIEGDCGYAALRGRDGRPARRRWRMRQRPEGRANDRQATVLDGLMAKLLW